MPDVICLGEALIDFIALESGVSLIEASGFKKAFGGTTANVSVAVSRLGAKSAFVGKVGDDPFGHFLESTMAENGVDTGKMLFDKSARTGLAFVSLKEGGVPDFMFYRNPSADMLLQESELDKAFISSTRIFHYGSISLISEPSRSATLSAAEIARGSGAIITYDPNLRLSLWESPSSAKAGMTLGLDGVHVVKLSEEELYFITGETGLEPGVRALMRIAGSIRLVFVTRGPEGCYYSTGNVSGDSPGLNVAAVDTTGAGDAFVGAMLSQMLQRDLKVNDISELCKSELDEIAGVANAVGALATTKRGAIASLPTYEELKRFVRQGKQ
ncbi:MAG TPA: PfkB family carbohydrate kinase [Armatimonadota bacterium]|jgi:fructokinase